MEQIADYYPGGKNRRHILVLSTVRGGHRTATREIIVSGKRGARQIAREHGATPWNF